MVRNWPEVEADIYSISENSLDFLPELKLEGKKNKKNQKNKKQKLLRSLLKDLWVN